MITVKLGRRRVEVYDYVYVPPFHGSFHCPPEPEAVEMSEDDVWLAPRLAPPRRRPKRVAKKLAQRNGELHFADGRALTEDEFDRLCDDESVQDRLCEIAGQAYYEDVGSFGPDEDSDYEWQGGT